VFTGDVDLDGHMDLVVSAAGADVSGLLDAGRVYVFRGPFTGSPQVLFAANAAVTLVEPQPQAGSGFGSAISGGRIEAEDGYALCVAAPYRDWPQRMDAGCAYRYQLSTTLDTNNAVTLVATLAAQYEGSRAGDLLGAQVLLLPASVVEPESALLVAAPRADPVAGVMLHDAGEVYRLRGARLSLSGTVSDAGVWHGESAGDLYGSSMASGDLDGDGLLDVAVGVFEYLPSGQAVQVAEEVAPSAAEYVPRLQVMHELWPAETPYMPAGHERQSPRSLRPVEGLYVPAGHAAAAAPAAQ
jgi:hypothetical protein